MPPPETYRDRFVVEPGGPLYLDGNSLGRMPKAAAELAGRVVNQGWGERLIRGWNEDWYALPRRLGAKVALLIGAGPDEVVVCDSTSINLCKLAMAGLSVQSPRRRIVSSTDNFPSDLYVLGRCGELSFERPDSSTALVALTQTSFRTAETKDLAAETRRAHAAGAWMLWDLSHSVGAVPIDLRACAAEFAVGCTYKYLNGGPGAPAFLYVRREVVGRVESPIAGWFGHRDPFAFSPAFEADATAAKFLAGTPPVLSMALMEPGLDLTLEAGIDWIRRRSLELTSRLMAAASRLGVECATPADPERRGSHVALRHPEAWRITRALIEQENVIPDFRAPDLIRFGVAALYNTEAEVDAAMERLAHVLVSRSYEQFPPWRSGVT